MPDKMNSTPDLEVPTLCRLTDWLKMYTDEKPFCLSVCQTNFAEKTTEPDRIIRKWEWQIVLFYIKNS